MAAGDNGLYVIESKTIGSAVSSVSFTSIPNTYRHLWVVVHFRGTRSAVDNELQITFNNDTSSNYEFGRGQGFNSTFYNNIYTSQNYLSLGNFPGSSASSTFYGVCEILIPEYAVTTNYRQMLSNSGDPQSGNAAISWRTGTWKNTSNAISSIQFTCELGNVDAGSVFSLYGMVGS